jgi:asparagine synthase (glutamine-hydrolysing)
MCGIVGIVNANPRESVDEARLKRMRDVLRHRGPDGEGLWIDGPVGLGHRRLSIIDVTGGAQPMTNEDGRLWITYNGEIYNHAELRPRLQARGHRYQSRSDTETILHLYEEDGERCVERLRGMFAFAVWDRRRGRLLLARDRLGIKPLYYAHTEHELLFASEIKAILAVSGRRAALNTAILPEFLATRYVAGAETFFQGIHKLLPGRTLSWSLDEGLCTRRYWQVPEVAGDGRSFTARAGEVRERLDAAVRSHLMSDVPLGLFLSGGLDSSALAALMARAVPEPIHTFGVGLDEPDANELPYARLMARSIGACHRDVTVTRGEFFQALPSLVWHEDEPIAFPSSVLLNFVSRLARDHVKVVLTGEGSDELFLGYNWYRVTAWNEQLGRLYSAATPAAARRAVRAAVGRLPWPIRRYASRTFLALEPGLRALFFDSFATFPEGRLRHLLVERPPSAARDPYAAWLGAYHAGSGGTLDRMSRADMATYLVELLMKQDQMSMAASIESRVPFLDHELVEYVTAMPARFKLRGWRTKAVLRQAIRDVVPREILTRRKMGFPVPVGRWFREAAWPLVAELVLGPRALARGLFEPAALRRLADEHRAGTARHGDRLWLLVNLELWHRIFVDGEDVGALARPAA